MTPRRGFTILELSVVLALMAIMVGVATVSMNGRLRGAHADQALEAVRALDHRARHDARTGPGEITLRLDTRAGKVGVADHRDDETVVDEYILPEGLVIEDAWVLLDARLVRRKTLSIPIGPHGTSATYGLTIRSEDEDGGHTTNALLVAGVSGQFTVFNDEDEVLDILSQAAGHDAD